MKTGANFKLANLKSERVFGRNIQSDTMEWKEKNVKSCDEQKEVASFHIRRLM